MADLPGTVTVTDVALRDGLQIQRKILSIADKLSVLDGLLGAGIRAVEATSFVHPGLVPQMADADEFWPRLPAAPDVHFTALVPNMRGLDRALAAGCRDIVLVLSASEGHSQANTRCSVRQALDRAAEMVERARNEPGVTMSVGIATAFVCPFDGVTPASQVAMIVSRLVGLGITRIGLADTLGKADPRQVATLASSMRDAFPQTRFALHLHNTYGTGMANAYAGLMSGVTEFDAALGGIGGCPFAPGAAGNIATEDLVYMCERMGVDTGVELEALETPAKVLRSAIGEPLDSSVSRALGW